MEEAIGMMKNYNNKKVMSLCKGKESLLIPYTDALLSFIFELRETGDRNACLNYNGSNEGSPNMP